MGLRGKHTNFYWDDSVGSPTDITSHVVEANGIPMTYDEVEVSAYGQDHSTMKGQGDSSPSLTVKFNDTTHALFTHETTGSLKSDTARTLLLEYGENAAPTTGDLTCSGEYVQIGAELQNAKDGQRLIVVPLRLSGGTMPAYGTKA